MSQYPPPDTHFGSTNAHIAPTGNAQATTVEGQYSERSRVNDDARNLATGTGYPVHFSSGGENDWPQDPQDDWIPGFGAMVRGLKHIQS